MCEHKPKIDETKTRSFLKAGSTRVVEVTLDTVILYVIGIPVWEGLPLSIGIEFMCFCVCYAAERIWNKIQFGRKILDNSISN